MIKVKYTSAALDNSGYASAARGYIDALYSTKEVELHTKVVSFEQEKTTHGARHKLVQELTGNFVKPQIQIIHLTPDNFHLHKLQGVYNIGYTVWETDKLPPTWTDMCNTMDEIWVPSQWNITVFKNSGVTVPVYCIPHVIDPLDLTQAETISIMQPDTFLFYSIFQFLERKHPVALLKAYFTEFNADDNVGLVLKTYRLNCSHSEKEMIRKDIAHLKASLKLDSYPPVVFFGDLEPEERMLGIHKRGDCFVLVPRAEGFGIPIAEAMSIGKPVITSNYSGITEFAKQDNSFLVNGYETPVCGMIFPNYTGDMSWFEPDISQIKKHMRYIFNNRQEAQKVADKGKQYIAKNFNKEVIGKLMLTHLKRIVNE